MPAAHDYASVGDVAAKYGVEAKVVSNLFWLGRLDRERCPVVAGRRLIPADYVAEVGRVLAERGHLPADSEK